jgi:PAP_fibrillin
VQVLSVLHGKWKLVYSTNMPVNGLIQALESVPFVSVGDIYQNIDAAHQAVENNVRVAMPYPVDLAISSTIELCTPHQAKLKVLHASADVHQAPIQVPQLQSVPPSIEIAGTTMDLTPLARLMAPIQSGLHSMQDAMYFATRPQIPVDQASFVMILLTTYVDTCLRIARGADNSVFIFVKDTSLE